MSLKVSRSTIFLILFPIDEIYLGYYFEFILHTFIHIFDPRLEYTILTNYLNSDGQSLVIIL